MNKTTKIVYISVFCNCSSLRSNICKNETHIVNSRLERRENIVKCFEKKVQIHYLPYATALAFAALHILLYFAEYVGLGIWYLQKEMFFLQHLA